MRRNRERPFFLYLPHFGVHAPHEARKELIEKFKAKPKSGGHDDPVYAAMIASVDESVGRILKVLDELKLATNTLVIFSSDNGGVGGYAQEGLKRSDGITDNAPLRGGKGMLYEGGIRVPWIFRWPGKIAPGSECGEPIVSVDLFPTLLEVAGASAPAKQPLDGVSCAKLLISGGKERLSREMLFWHFPGYLGAGKDSWRTTPVGVIRAGDWKLMQFFEDGRLELYHLRNDRGEQQNLSAKQPERRAKLQARLEQWRKEVAAKMPTANKLAE